MLSADPARALEWRLQTRALFTHYLAAGYRVVDFALDQAAHRGRYLLTTIRTSDTPA
jgi:predicted GNAT superfamily acetyltransferase